MVKKLKRFLYLFHRWLGVALCLWFALLFASGIIMMYVDYPELTEEERLWQMETLQASAVHLTPEDAARHTGSAAFSALKLSNILGRPAYQFTLPGGRNAVIFADDGTSLRDVSAAQALAAAQHSTFAAQGGVPRYTGLIDIDQWTVSSVLDPNRPLHRIALDDAAGTVLYVSSHNGQIVRDTHATERLWNWLGSTVHWIYPWQFRQHAGLWAWVLTYLSLAGVFSVISGAVIGWWRLRIKRPYHGERLTPYRGWQKWHHVLGLGFLLFISTWTFSGLMSMSPWGLFDNATNAEEQTARYYGGALDDLTAFPALPSSALAGIDPVKEVEWRRIGTTYYLVLSHSATDKSLILPPNATRLKEVMTHALAHLQPQAAVQEQRVLTSYDSWYYSHHNRYRPLPALEVHFDDAEQSWYYLDLNTGAVVQRLTATDRWARWLYNGLHSLDFAPLFSHRPLWDVVVILLCLAGFGFALTAVVIGWRRLRAS
jgi:hypothetical protein